MPAAVLLAAGGSTRMGQPKALLSLPDGRPLARAWLDRLAERCAPRLVVAGAVVAPLAALLGEDERLVVNPRWADTGPVDSLALAVRALPPAVTRAVVSPVDVPPPSSAALARLLAAPAPAVLCWQDTPGHPVCLGPAQLAALREGPPPAEGLRALLKDATCVQSDTPDATLNLNRPEEWAAWITPGRGR
ncbi:MAG: NTP transferase domain-containing protein [Alphaproteobacteria bacterium]|nr:NTP transferase domain-containing protein [Alphaproteobacteria bacterium]